MKDFWKKLFLRLVSDKFVLYTAVVSGILGSLYIWKGLQTQFFVWAWLIIGMNFLYIPLAFIFRRGLFPFFYLFYSGILIFTTAFDKTFLYNNYTALFVVCIVCMIQPKIRRFAIISYFVLVSVAFALNEEVIYHYFIHVVRSLWFFGIVDFVLNDKFKRKKLVLFQDERQILDQLCGGLLYQKEVEGFSENTIYRKLKAARERNGIPTREKLVELYRAEKEEEL